MLHQAPRVLRSLAAMAVLCLFAACDDSAPDDVARSLPCSLDDEECAALPGAAEALTLVQSMNPGVDVDPADVELVEDASQLEGLDQEAIDALTSGERPPVAQKFSCSGNDSATCCCFWDGPYWGCGCI
jgi:hypothetical protein